MEFVGKAFKAFKQEFVMGRSNRCPGDVVLPGHDVHAFIDRSCFGKVYWKVHREMDKPVVYLGKSHRTLFHDPVTAVGIATELYPGDDNAGWAALFHISLDESCTRDPIFKKQLEMLARKAKKKKKRKKRAPTTKRKEDPDAKLRRQLEEAARYWRIIKGRD